MSQPVIGCQGPGNALQRQMSGMLKILPSLIKSVPQFGFAQP